MERCVGSGKDLAQRNDGSQHLDITQMTVCSTRPLQVVQWARLALCTGLVESTETLRLRDLHCKEQIMNL